MTNIPYNLNIPFGPNNPSTDQPDMFENTNSIAQLIAVDHVGFDTNGSGIHQKSTYPTSVLDPGLGDGTGVLYGKAPSVSVVDNYPFWKNATDVYQLAGPTKRASSGSTILPGGIIMQWGVTTLIANTVVAFDTVINPFTTVYSISIAPETSIAATLPCTVKTATVSTAGFTVFVPQVQYIRLFWTAIGV